MPKIEFYDRILWLKFKKYHVAFTLALKHPKFDITPKQTNCWVYDGYDCKDLRLGFIWISIFYQEPQEDVEPDLQWLCWCGNFQEDGLHCDLCGNEPPWGCDCSYCDNVCREEEGDMSDYYDPYEQDYCCSGE